MLVSKFEDLGRRYHGPSLDAFVLALALDFRVLFGEVRPTCNCNFNHAGIIAGRLYIAGGIRNQNITQKHYYRDLFYLDLDKLDEWHELRPYPIPESISGIFIGWTMVVRNSKAYLFTGRTQLDTFDLVAEKWGSVTTRMKNGQGCWPYEGNSLIDYTMQLLDAKLYVFGGAHFGSQLGCNILMELDLESLEWQYLSGTPMPQADYSCPGPRVNCMSWVTSDRLFIMYGMANRQAAKLHHQQHGADMDYPYDDMWSFDVHEHKWRKERLLGNLPCPRCESACIYVCTIFLSHVAIMLIAPSES
jgi:hypothetical protein